MSIDLKACLVIYDIPETPLPGQPKVQNPSRQFRRHGARVNLSCWVIPEANIPWNRLQKMEQGGATWHVVRFASEESEKIIQMAEDAIMKDLKRTLSSMNKSIHNAANRLGNGEENEYSLADYETRCKAVIKSTKETIDALKQAANNFRLEFGTSATAALTAINAAETSAKAKAKAYVEMKIALEKIDPALAQAAEKDDAPPEILIDRLQDQDIEVSEERELFRSPEVAETAENLRSLDISEEVIQDTARKMQQEIDVIEQADQYEDEIHENDIRDEIDAEAWIAQCERDGPMRDDY